MTFPFPVVRDWDSLQSIVDLIAEQLPALQGVGRVEYGLGEVEFSASDTATVTQAHSLGTPPAVQITSRDSSVVFAQPAGVSDTDFPVEAFSLSGARSDTVEFLYFAVGHVTT